MLAVDLSALPPARLVPIYIQLGEPKYVDFKENLFKVLTQVTSGVNVDSNLRPVNSQSATLTTRPLLTLRNNQNIKKDTER